MLYVCVQVPVGRMAVRVCLWAGLCVRVWLCVLFLFSFSGRVFDFCLFLHSVLV